MSQSQRNSQLVAFARENRQVLTASELAVWRAVRHEALGVGFRRQHPVGRYILDFACLRLRLAIEIDGSQHFESQGDQIRDAYLGSLGWTVLRFSTYEVMTNLDVVLESIHAEIRCLQAVEKR